MYYQLSLEKRAIVDSLEVTEGTIVNWRMMETVIQEVDRLDHLVQVHGAADYEQGRAMAVVHTMNWTNVVKRDLVIFTLSS